MFQQSRPMREEHKKCTNGSSPQVKCARWQAKQALRAFFLLGRKGSFAFDFCPFCADFPSPASGSSAISFESCSPPLSISSGDGERDPSSASEAILLYACGLPGLVPCQYAARSTQTRDRPCKRCRPWDGKSTVETSRHQAVLSTGRARCRLCPRSCCFCKYPSLHPANPPRGASTQSVGTVAQERASARMTSAGRRRWLSSASAAAGSYDGAGSDSLAIAITRQVRQSPSDVMPCDGPRRNNYWQWALFR